MISHFLQLAQPPLLPLLRDELGLSWVAVYSGLDLGALVAPPMYGWLLDRSAPRAMFMVVAGLMLVIILTVVQVRRRALPAPAPASAA